MTMVEKEELLALVIILGVMIGLVLTGHLTDQAVSVLEWVGGAFMSAKGIQGLLPKGN